MKTRIWCKKHKRWHSKHAFAHCKMGFCPRVNKGRPCPMKRKP